MKIRNTSINTYELEKSIASLFSSLDIDVFNTDVESSKKDIYPRLVYEHDYLSYMNCKYQYILEVNIWDETSNYLSVEKISDQVINILDGQIVRNETLCLLCYKDSALKIKDENTSLRRKRLIFHLDVFFY